MNIETILCFSFVMASGYIDREKYTILNNILAKSLGSGIADIDDDEEEKSGVIHLKRT